MNADTRPKGFQDVVKSFGTTGCGSPGEGSNGEDGHRLDFPLFIRKIVMGETINEIPVARQSCVSHHDAYGDCPVDTDAGAPSKSLGASTSCSRVQL